jgi:hypothetical protein
VTHDRGATPVSVEWTVPYGASILHLGIHNLPACSEREWLAAMGVYTASPNEARLPEMLRALARIPDALIVLNHPFWLEEGVLAAIMRRPGTFLPQCLEWIHMRSTQCHAAWRENAAIALARLTDVL